MKVIIKCATDIVSWIYGIYAQAGRPMSKVSQEDHHDNLTYMRQAMMDHNRDPGKLDKRLKKYDATANDNIQ